MDDDFYTDDFSENFTPKGWTEKDWFIYLKKSEKEITTFANLYDQNRITGKSLEDIAILAGWPIPIDDDNNEDDDEDENDSAFSEEPWTLLNHPIYVITRALLKCLRKYFRQVILESQIPAILVWDISKILNEGDTFMALAANSTDLSEDLLARCNYKMSAVKLNDIMAKLIEIPQLKSHLAQDRIARIETIIFDLRQICLNMAETSTVEKQ